MTVAENTKISAAGPAAFLSVLGGPLLLAVAALAAIPTFWFGLVSLVDAWATPEYSHGPIVPFISLFLFLRDIRQIPQATVPITDRWPGVIVVAVGLLIGALGNVASVSHFVTYGFIVWVAGVVIIGLGLRRATRCWHGVLHLVFMLPLPQFVYWQISTYLQTVSSEIGVWLIMLMGVPVYLDGNVIDLGIYKLQVAEACSGLRYLYPMLSFSYVFAVLYQGPLWHKLLLLLAAAPITVAMNSFRIGVIGVLVNSYGIEHAEGFLHTFEGWVIFIACIVILFVMTIMMQWLSGDRRSLSEALDINFDGLGAQMARASAVPVSASLGLAAALTISSAAAWTFAPEIEVRAPAREPLVLFPKRIGDWQGRMGPLLDPGIEQVLGADDYLSVFYDSPNEATVDLFIAYYNNQMDGTGIHSPEVCIPAGGWEVSGWERETLTLSTGRDVNIVRAVIQKGMQRQLVYFWFDLRGRTVNGEFMAKFVNVIDSTTDGRSDGALVRLITPINPREDMMVADARLTAFLEEVVGVLPRFVPH